MKPNRAAHPHGKESLIVVGATPPPPHGVSVFNQLLLSTLRSRGFLAAHLDISDRRSLANIGRLDLQNVRLGAQHASTLVRLMRRHPGACVYLPIAQEPWGFVRDAVFTVLAAVRNRRIYLHFHGGEFNRFYAQSNPLLRFAIRRTLASAFQVWVLTPSRRSSFDGLVPTQRIRVLENAVTDPATEEHSPPIARPSGEGAFRILYLSNTMPSKGPFVLLSAIERIGSTARNIHLRIVGSGDPRSTRGLRERVLKLTCTASVELVGPVFGAQKLEQYKWADVFVFPSYAPEGQPLVLLEAMACGLPIVATRKGCIPETARDGQEALLIPPRDAGALATVIDQLLSNPDLRATLGRNARARYEARYTPQRFERELVRLLQS
jgi:glycosyltransferase involved in cell wall biosynthesis